MTWLLLWLVLAGPLWAVIGSRVIAGRYRTLGLDPRRTRVAGAVSGAAFGPLGVAWLYTATPELSERRYVLVPSVVVAGTLWLLFRVNFPENACNTSLAYVTNQVQNGLSLGLVYAAMAVGLTLIFSVLNIISFAHGQFFMLGGVIGYFLATEVWGLNAVVGIPIAGVACLALGMVFERTMLAPMHGGRIERAGEYGILTTFGFGLFLQFALVAFLGSPTGVRAPRYTDRPVLGIDVAAFDLGPLRLRTDLLIAGVLGVLMILALAWFLQRTWTGKSFRAIAQDRNAASVVGVDSGRTSTLAFGVGTMLAGLAGAALIPALNFPVPQIAGRVLILSFVIIVLGGLGSVLGAALGGIFVGVTEALGAGCFPDPTRASSYQLAFPLVLFALTLLARPQGFFGRAQ